MVAKKQVVLFSLLLLVAAFIGNCSAASFTVGDTTGWTIPSSSSFYSTWASKQTFQLGDVLVFNFAAGAHTVAEVTKASYDSCNTTNPLSVQTTSPANITLTSAGPHYYICTFPGHCGLGQKLFVVATGPSPSTPAPTTTPTPPPKSSPTPKPSTTPAAPTTTTSSPSPTPAPATPSAPAPSPTTTTSPPSPTTPAAPATSPSTTPSGSSTTPSALAPASPAAGSTPPAGSFAAPAAAGVSLLSLFSIAAAALLF